MNEFLGQFLIESRELVDRATDDLLALEKSPADKERLDAAFRGFHTLKGGAGIVEFAAMAHALHLAEEALDQARAGAHRVTAAFVDACLGCLDQVTHWLDEIEARGELPSQAETAAVAMVARFEQLMPKAPASAPASARSGSAAVADSQWVSALLAAHPDAAGKARTAVHYRPDADCFFRNQDPLALIAGLPGLLALDIEPAAPWPPLEELDPFTCNLRFRALSDRSMEELGGAFGDELRRCDVIALADQPQAWVQQAASGAAQGADSQRLRQAGELLEAQLALLNEPGERGLKGRIASAATVAANVLRQLGRGADADALAVAAAESLQAGVPDDLRRRLQDALAAALPRAATGVQAARQENAAPTLRVDAARIDALVSLTGELTVAKNALGHTARLAQEQRNPLAAALKDRHMVLERLIGELQRSALGMRILPLRHVFQRFPRLIREISAELKKPAILVVEGEDTEADKAIVEVLFEPLLHVLRNAMDHGIEDAAARAAAGKPAIATVRMRASRQGEHVLVEVADDGRGVDVGRVRQVASGRGLVPEEALAAMSEEEVIELIFAPGFSTAEQVTGLSGRGVGMDAVRAAVKRLGGSVTLKSQAGRGSSVRFLLPFSVMMTQVMVVEAGGQKFGIPLESIVETLRIPRERIAPVGGAHAIVVRDTTIPLLELSKLLGSARERQVGDATVVVASVNGNLGALQVDRLTDRMEIMLKPLEGLLAGTPGISGSTLMGDGSVLLVLDLGELLR